MAIEDVIFYARSGWRPENGEFYCLVCDESLHMVPGRTTGDRAPTWEEIHHDAECPVPDLIALLAAKPPEVVSTDANHSNDSSPRAALSGDLGGTRKSDDVSGGARRTGGLAPDAEREVG